MKFPDISGKVVKRLVNETREAGFNSSILDLKEITKGIYFLKISIKGEKISQKLISIQ